MRVLLIQDDGQLASKLVGVLGANGHHPTWCRLGGDALPMLFMADLILLDLGVSDVDGLELLREVRSKTSAPVLAMSGQNDELSVVRALRSGADDYLAKPVRPRELLARIDAIGRRIEAGGPAERVVQVDDVVINLDARTVQVLDVPVTLTTKEFEVLSILARNSGTAVSRREIMTEVWGEVHLPISRSLDVHMTALRNKLKRPELLHTIRGFGYRLG